jgi:hypothetical protein
MLHRIALFTSLLLPAAFGAAQTSNDNDVTRATLDNGLQVVIVRDALAPVATKTTTEWEPMKLPPASQAWPTPRSIWLFEAALV